MENLPSVALSIAGSDNCAGAGIQADLKTFTAFGVYGLTAVTTVVAEVPGCVKSVYPIAVESVADQIALSFDAFPVAAVKTGMLWSAVVIECVAAQLRPRSSRTGGRLPVVIDPVMVASSGASLLQPDAIAAYREQLFPLADLITPNLDEARALVGRSIIDLAELERAGRELVALYGAAFLMKGGHFRGERAVDLLVAPNATTVRFEAIYNPAVDTHGTGCTFSAAITAGLAKGSPLETAVAEAKLFICQAIDRSFRFGTVSALNHFR